MGQAFNKLGVRINATNLALACRKIDEWIDGKEETYACITPVATIIDCQDTLANGAYVWLSKLCIHMDPMALFPRTVINCNILQEQSLFLHHI